MIEIITEGFCEGNKILLDEISCTYLQDNDCTENSDGLQSIILSTRDGGGGKFINIKTENWSLDDPKDLVKLLNHFKSLYKNENINNS